MESLAKGFLDAGQRYGTSGMSLRFLNKFAERESLHEAKCG